MVFSEPESEKPLLHSEQIKIHDQSNNTAFSAVFKLFFAVGLAFLLFFGSSKINRLAQSKNLYDFASDVTEITNFEPSISDYTEQIEKNQNIGYEKVLSTEAETTTTAKPQNITTKISVITTKLQKTKPLTTEPLITKPLTTEPLTTKPLTTNQKQKTYNFPKPELLQIPTVRSKIC